VSSALPVVIPELPINKPNLHPAQSMSEAGRTILAYHFAKMLSEIPVIVEGHNIEAIHDMRVATRRMRSALRLFRPYYKRSVTRPMNRSLRQIADQLGEVRDLDVFRMKAETHAEALSARDRSHFRAFLSLLQQQESEARERLLRMFMQPEFAEFLERTRDFVETAGDGNRRIALVDEDGYPVPHAIRDVVPALIYLQVGAMRAYEPLLEGASLDMLHALRIEAKRLRYMLESFTSVLGPESKEAIDAVKALQDFLGELQDARVAQTMLTHYLNDGNKIHSPMQRRTIRDYIKTRDDEQNRLRASVGQAWAAFTRPEVRRALASAVAVL